jgi:beta-1,4-mannosyl-glycoprotein beta-1,4-N-acetylglucosaminyltransferase
MKIFDTITFFNELDLLELRLNILNDVVDYFVINEANITFTGKEKPLYYYENRERFKKWEHKIIHHVTVDNNETLEKYWEGVPYHRSMIENDIYKLPIHYQRACFHKDSAIYALLDKAQDADIILTGDADEIIKPEVVEQINEWFDPNNHYVAQGPVYYYYLNLLCEPKWMSTRICTMKMLKTMSVDKLRQSYQQSFKIENGSWHWSFFGDADTVRAKMDAYEHQEHNLPQFRDSMEERIKKGIDPFGRDYLYSPHVIPIDDSFPEYITDNLGKYSKYIRPWN